MWRTKEGFLVRLGDMTDTHLMNAHKMLRRLVDKHDRDAIAGFSYNGNPDGMGAYYAEQAANESMDKAIDFSRGAQMLWDELRRRYPDERSVRSYVERLSGRRVRRRDSC